MGKRRISGYEFTCEKCGFQWRSVKKDKPATCANPRCRSPLWDKPREKAV